MQALSFEEVTQICGARPDSAKNIFEAISNAAAEIKSLPNPSQMSIELVLIKHIPSLINQRIAPFYGSKNSDVIRAFDLFSDSLLRVGEGA